MSLPQLALCLKDPEAIQSVTRVTSAASSGLDLLSGNDLASVLEGASPETLKLLILDADLLPPGALDEIVSVCPGLAVLVVADEIDDALLATALRIPGLVGFVGRSSGMARSWELAYLVRRVVSPQQPPPGAHELLSWGASSVVFRPRTTRDRDQAVEAVEVVAVRFGVPRRLASVVAEASHELLMNAMFDAPVDPDGRPRYAADRRAAISLLDHEVPTLRLSVDGAHVALDISDPFGRLPRDKLFGGLLRGRTGTVATSASTVLDTSHGGAGLGLFKLFGSASILRVEVVPNCKTVVSWIMDRSVDRRAHRSQSRSVYYVQATGNAP